MLLLPVEQATLVTSEKEIQLPHLELTKTYDLLAERRYDITLTGKFAELLGENSDTNSQTPVYGLLYTQIVIGADLYLNGKWIGGLPQSTETVRWSWYRPLLVPFPPHLLRNDGQPNVITVVQFARVPYTVFNRPYIGNLASLTVVNEVIKFISSTLSNAANIFCLIIGLFMIGAWLASPDDKIFLFAGTAAILWALIFTLGLTTYVPMHLYKLWRLAIFMCESGLSIFMAKFVLEFIGEPLSKSRHYLLVGYASILPIVYLIGGIYTEYALDRFFTAPLIAGYIYACIRVAIYYKRTKNKSALILLIQSLLCAILALHDYGMLTGDFLNIFPVDPLWSWSRILFEPIFLSHFGVPLLLLIMCYILLAQYQTQVHSIASANIHLQAKLKDREFELSLSHEHQRQLVRVEATRLERDRIYQDVHDGIGSRLVTAVFSLRQGHHEPNAIEAQLLDCLSDLRLVINSQNEDDIDIQTAIFDYCSQQESHLVDSGLLLSYDVGQGPSIKLPPHTQLNILRILQEALTNTIKHAEASEIFVKLEHDGAELTLLVIDNGQGMGVSSAHQQKSASFGPSGGRGLTGMAARATAIGGAFSIGRFDFLTRACLKVPLVMQAVED